VPAVYANGKIVSGGVLEEIARVVGFDYTPPAILEPVVLMERWYEILTTAVGLIRQIPDASLSATSPEMGRTLLAMCWHIVSIGRVYLLEYDEVPSRTPRPDDVVTTEQLGAFGEETRELLRTWWDEIGQFDPLDRVVETYQGIQTLHEYLERETWHTAHHTRQITLFMRETLGLTPVDPLTPEVLEGLPLPDQIWGG